MITANLAGSSLQPSHLRGEREKFKSHSRLNLNEDNSDSASNKQNPEEWNPNDTNSEHGQKSQNILFCNTLSKIPMQHFF